MLCLLFVELCAGWYTLNSLIQHQTAQFFRLCQEEETHAMRALNNTGNLSESSERSFHNDPDWKPRRGGIDIEFDG